MPFQISVAVFDGANCRWSVLNEADLEKMLGGQLPDMQERARLVREVGASISGTWTCNVSNMIRAAGGSACQLVDIVTSSFSGFRDSCIYRFMALAIPFQLSLIMSMQGSSNFSAEARSDICGRCMGHAQVPL